MGLIVKTVLEMKFNIHTIYNVLHIMSKSKSRCHLQFNPNDYDSKATESFTSSS